MKRGAPRAARAPSPEKTGAPALGEWEALSILRQHLGSRAGAGVRLGIGDDAAVLEDPGAELVWTTDACLEHVHFELEWLAPEDVAWKALHAAVSDVAAMGATPVGALCHVTWTPSTSRAWLERFARGQAEAAREARCPVIGGNLALGADFQVVTSVIGSLKARAGSGARPEALLRSGARAGDELWLLGSLGLASLGLELLRAGAPARRGAARVCVDAFRRPRALVMEGPRLLGRATACLDVSDGLLGDAAHLAQASGARVVLDARRLLEIAAPELLVQAKKLRLDPLDRILRGGEDYALLATGPRGRRPSSAQLIGRVEAGRGVWLDSAASSRELLGGGFEHGAIKRRG